MLAFKFPSFSEMLKRYQETKRQLLKNHGAEKDISKLPPQRHEQTKEIDKLIEDLNAYSSSQEDYLIFAGALFSLDEHIRGNEYINPEKSYLGYALSLTPFLNRLTQADRSYLCTSIPHIVGMTDDNLVDKTSRLLALGKYHRFQKHMLSLQIHRRLYQTVLQNVTTFDKSNLVPPLEPQPLEVSIAPPAKITASVVTLESEPVEEEERYNKFISM
ncbi:MAG: hypothetical protein EPO11_04425 [Gammaproteobacteria bacterium]|nr:MAG: hypothetical protein EPO11_04425 [Gammaproteobacteria bacterium]